MAVSWSKELDTGNLTIDSQHKHLVQTFNTLMEACASGKGAGEIESTLKFLCDYTVRHFADEEAWQRRNDYPEFQRHKQLHDNFKTTAVNLFNQFKKEGPSVRLVVQLNSDIGGWLINHIRKEDTKIAAHIRKLAAG